MRAGAPPPPADTEPPTWGAVAKNDSIICPYEPVNFTSSLWNDNTTLDSWIFSINLSGTWENATSVAFAEPNATENVTTIILAPYSVVEWKFFGNDTENNENVTATQSFVVAYCITNTTSVGGACVEEYVETESEQMTMILFTMVFGLVIVSGIFAYLGVHTDREELKILFVMMSLILLAGAVYMTTDIGEGYELTMNETVTLGNTTKLWNMTSMDDMTDLYEKSYLVVLGVAFIVFIISVLGYFILKIGELNDAKV